MGEVEALEEEEGGEGNKPRKETSKIDSDVINGRMLTMAGLFDVCAMDRPEVRFNYCVRKDCQLELFLGRASVLLYGDYS